jgi:hypothetical protein
MLNTLKSPFAQTLPRFGWGGEGREKPDVKALTLDCRNGLPSDTFEQMETHLLRQGPHDLHKYGCLPFTLGPNGSSQKLESLMHQLAGYANRIPIFDNKRSNSGYLEQSTRSDAYDPTSSNPHFDRSFGPFIILGYAPTKSKSDVKVLDISQVSEDEIPIQWMNEYKKATPEDSTDSSYLTSDSAKKLHDYEISLQFDPQCYNGVVILNGWPNATHYGTNVWGLLHRGNIDPNSQNRPRRVYRLTLEL